MKRSIIFGLLILFSTAIVAQNDNVLWASPRLEFIQNEQLSFAARPIVRRNQDFSNHQNWSIDLSAKYKFDNGVSIQLLDRIWFLPDGRNRNFIFADLSRSSELESIPLKVTSRIRIHWAHDLKGIEDRDFIRPFVKLEPAIQGRIKPYVGAEPFLNLTDDFLGSNRIRWQIGATYKINQKFGLHLYYWNEDFTPTEAADFNIWGIILNYKILQAKS